MEDTSNYIKERFVQHRNVHDELKRIIEQGPWDKSIFLKAIRERLQRLENYFNRELRISEGYLLAQAADAGVVQAMDRTGQLKVYVSIYNADGNDDDKWLKIIQNLEGGVVTRPVYRLETDVLSMLRTKPNTNNEGYIELYILPGDIVDSGEESHDKDGRELVYLKDASIKLENVERFVHQEKILKIQFGKFIEVENSKAADAPGTTES